jgi:hypothetical protein
MQHFSLEHRRTIAHHPDTLHLMADTDALQEWPII